MSKKEEAFKLFEEGKNPFSPEVKAFELKSHTSYNYYLEWQEDGGITPSSSPSGEAKDSTAHVGGIDKTKPAKAGTNSPSGEVIGGIDETRQMKKEAKSPGREAKPEKPQRPYEILWRNPPEDPLRNKKWRLILSF